MSFSQIIKKSMKNKTRRNFLKKSGLLTTGFFIVPRNVLGGNGFISPSDQLNIGAIGIGGKGQDIMGAWAKNERVIALCDVDPENSVNGVTKSRNYYPKANFYEDFREMLDREKDLDAVTVSTPDHTHAIIASNAMKKGLHVYVQKPLTHNIQEARILTKLAKENKVVTQMGNQGGSCSGVSKIQEWIDKKLIGKVSKINVWTDRPVWPQGFQMKRSSQKKPNNLNWDLWLGPANYTDYTTELHPFNWRGWWDYGTGALGDMGCHLLDVPFKSLELGYPTGVECSVATVFEKAWNHNYVPEGCPSSSIVTLNFNETSKNKSKVELVWMDGGLRPSHPQLIPPDDFLGEEYSRNGVLMIGEKGVISCGTYARNPKLYIKGEKTITFNTDSIGEEVPFLDFIHHEKWIKACKKGYNSNEHKNLSASFDYAGPFTEAVLMGNLAIRSYMLIGTKNPKYSENTVHVSEHDNYIGRKKLLWDGSSMKITNFDSANQFVGRVSRPGWKI